MIWLQNSIVFLGSWIAFIGSIVWGIVEGGYEPWIVAILGLVGIAANSHLLPLVRKNGSRLTAEQRIAARDKWRPIFESYFLDNARRNHRSDCIVHDVQRLDDYPNGPDRKRGMSAWFRVGLMGTYQHGVLLGLRWTYVVSEGGKWKERPGDGLGQKVILLGAVPYESIESVNFDGDHYYSKPHLFCHFEHSGEPYERLFFGEEFQLDPSSPKQYLEMAEYQPLRSWLPWRN